MCGRAKSCCRHSSHASRANGARLNRGSAMMSQMLTSIPPSAVVLDQTAMELPHLLSLSQLLRQSLKSGSSRRWQRGGVR